MGYILSLISILSLFSNNDNPKNEIIIGGNLQVPFFNGTYTQDWHLSELQHGISIQYHRPKYQYGLELFTNSTYRHENRKIGFFPELVYEPYIEDTEFNFVMLGLNFARKLNHNFALGLQLEYSLKGEVRKKVIYSDRPLFFSLKGKAISYGFTPFIDYNKAIVPKLNFNARLGFNVFETESVEELALFNAYGNARFVYSLGFQYALNRKKVTP